MTSAGEKQISAFGAWGKSISRILRGLFATLACVTAPTWAATPGHECGKPLSLAKLIANPSAYHGKAVCVVAHVTIDFENMTACPSESETAIKRCLWLTIDDGSHKTDQDYARYQSKLKAWQQFNRQTVAIRATFNKTEKGHFSMWPGGLGKITAVSGKQGGWSFITNAAVPADQFVSPR